MLISQTSSSQPSWVWRKPVDSLSLPFWAVKNSIRARRSRETYIGVVWFGQCRSNTAVPWSVFRGLSQRGPTRATTVGHTVQPATHWTCSQLTAPLTAPAPWDQDRCPTTTSWASLGAWCVKTTSVKRQEACGWCERHIRHIHKIRQRTTTLDAQPSTTPPQCIICVYIYIYIYGENNELPCSWCILKPSFKQRSWDSLGAV